MEMKFVTKEYLQWVSAGCPNITRCCLTHPELYKFCKARGVANYETVAKEILKSL